jgi:hypothetical protein
MFMWTGFSWFNMAPVTSWNISEEHTVSQARNQAEVGSKH